MLVSTMTSRVLSLTKELALQTALSPTNFSLVEILEDGKIKWHPISYTLNDLSTITDG